MDSQIITYIGCFRCEGTGIEPEHEYGGETIPERECPYCGGDGAKTIAHIIDATGLKDILDDIKDKVDDIKEVVDGL